MVKPSKVTKLYKFLNEKYVDGLITRGELRIGTAEEYRILDGKAGARSDPDELITDWRPRSEPIVVDRSHFLGQPDWPDGRHVKVLFNDEVNIRIKSNNVYLFSTSYCVTPNMRRRMAREFDADACVRIGNIAQFMFDISCHNLLLDRPCAIDAISYVAEGPIVGADMKRPEPFKKYLKFRWQREVRIMWGGENVSPKGRVITVPSIIPLLKRIY